MADAQPDTTQESSKTSIPATTPLHATTFDLSDRGALCPAIVAAVSAAVEVPAHELAEPLNDVIDVDALEQLFRPRLDGTARPDGRVDFTYCGRRVVLECAAGEGSVSVRPETR